jgi:hypothetical protein
MRHNLQQFYQVQNLKKKNFILKLSPLLLVCLTPKSLRPYQKARLNNKVGQGTFGRCGKGSETLKPNKSYFRSGLKV